MNLTNYINKKVHIVLNNDFTYIGTVNSSDSDSLTLTDKYNHKISLKESAINFIKELE